MPEWKGRWNASAPDQMPNERIAEPTNAAFDSTPKMRARAASVSMIAMTTADTGGLAMPTMFVSASHWWMTGVLTCETLPSSSCRVCPWMNPGCHLKLASQAQSTPNRMRTTAAPRSQRRPKTAERVAPRDESTADGASRVVDKGVHLSVDRGFTSIEPNVAGKLVHGRCEKPGPRSVYIGWASCDP